MTTRGVREIHTLVSERCAEKVARVQQLARDHGPFVDVLGAEQPFPCAVCTCDGCREGNALLTEIDELSWVLELLA